MGIRRGDARVRSGQPLLVRPHAPRDVPAWRDADSVLVGDAVGRARVGLERRTLPLRERTRSGSRRSGVVPDEGRVRRGDDLPRPLGRCRTAHPPVYRGTPRARIQVRHRSCDGIRAPDRQRSAIRAHRGHGRALEHRARRRLPHPDDITLRVLRGAESRGRGEDERDSDLPGGLARLVVRRPRRQPDRHQTDA